MKLIGEECFLAIALRYFSNLLRSNGVSITSGPTHTHTQASFGCIGFIYFQFCDHRGLRLASFQAA